MNALIALVWTGALDLMRRRLYAAALAAGLLMIGAALALESLSAGETSRVLTSVGLAFIVLICDIIGVVGAIVILGREIETRQAIQILVRPVTRATYLVSRWAALSIVSFVTSAVLGAVLAGLVAGLGVGDVSAARVVGAAVVGTLETSILIACAILMTAGSSTTLAAVVTAIVFMVGRLDDELARLVARAAFGPVTPVVDVAHRLLPQLSRFDLTGFVGGDAPAESIAWVVAYGVLYTCAVLLLATARFRRFDLA